MTPDRTIIEWPPNGRAFISNLRAMPFEVCVALVGIWTGATAGLRATPAQSAFQKALPMAMTATFNVLYLVSGIVMVVGLGLGHRRLEAVGLVLFLTSVAARVVALAGTTEGFALLSSLVTLLLFAGAAAVRLYVLVKNGTLIHTNHKVSVG